MVRALILQLILSLYGITVGSSVPGEVELLLANLIYTNNMSRVLYISQHPETEKLSLRDTGFLMIQDVSCGNPEILEHSEQHFLGIDDALKMNIIIDCGSDRPIQNILLKILPLKYYKNKSLLFLLPMFNIIIVLKEQPDFSEQNLLYPTKDLILALALITEPEVLLAPDIIPMGPSCNAYSVYKYHQDEQTDSLPGHFTMMATLNKDCTIEGRTDVLWHSFPGFMGRLNPPFLTQEISDNGEVIYGGLYKVFLDSLSDGLNFTYRIINSVDGSYGIPNKAGEWDGLIGLLQRMEIDIVMTWLTITAARNDVVDFTIPVWEDPVMAVYRGGKPDIGWLYLFQPFQYQVWFVLLASIVVASFFMWALQFSVFHKSETIASLNPCFSWSESSWILLGGCLVQDCGSVAFSNVLTVATMVGYIMSAKREYYARLDPLSYYTDKKFVQRYRLSKPVVRVLIRRFKDTQEVKIPRGRYGIPHSFRVCVALRYFATGANYLAIGDCHGISKSSVSRAVRDVSEYFREHLQEYVHWPDSEMDKTCKAMAFYQKTKKPRCFGLVDGTHVAISCPRGLTQDENQYFCYKGYYSINTMIICDFFGVILHVNAANPDTCNDIYVMNSSQIKYLGERRNFKGFYLLGDSGYVLSDYLLTPVKFEQTNADTAYNKWHKKTRSRVERCIGVLKQRWRCLDSSGGYLFHDPHRASCIIESCVCLHNCAKAGKVCLLKDYPSKDGFRRIQPAIEQPDNQVRAPRAVFQNMRHQFINDYFSAPRC